MAGKHNGLSASFSGKHTYQIGTFFKAMIRIISGLSLILFKFFCVRVLKFRFHAHIVQVTAKNLLRQFFIFKFFILVKIGIYTGGLDQLLEQLHNIFLMTVYPVINLLLIIHETTSPFLNRSDSGHILKYFFL